MKMKIYPPLLSTKKPKFFHKIYLYLVKQICGSHLMLQVFYPGLAGFWDSFFYAHLKSFHTRQRCQNDLRLHASR